MNISPEQVLWIGVIRQAFADIALPDEIEAMKAAHWLFSPELNEAFSQTCSNASAPVHYVRRTAREVIRETKPKSLEHRRLIQKLKRF